MSLWAGQEWEIAFSAVSAGGGQVPMGSLLDRIDQVLVENVTHVNSTCSGWWLASGGRYYRDASDGGRAHSEITSPECDNPDELLRQDRAAERFTLRLAELAAGGDRIREVCVSKATTCPTAVTSWGLHENYETSARVPDRPMLAWLASRIALTGAGGLDVTYPGVRFTVSPRAHFIHEPVSSGTQWNRGLHNVGKASPNGCRYRVHVIAGEGNRAPLSSWLRFATTAIVVRLLDLNRGPRVDLFDPVAALHTFALDPACRSMVPSLVGAPASMIGLQRAFLEAAKAWTTRLPDWAPHALAEWEMVLDTLDSAGWHGLVGRLDWPTKLSLFGKVLSHKGWTWEAVAEVNRQVDEAREHFGLPAPEATGTGARDLHAAVLERVAQQLGKERTDEFTALRLALAAVEARYMQLGEASLFDALALPANGLGMAPGDLPADPLELPAPPNGRAAVRAELVREHGWKGSGHDKHVLGSWTRFVVDGRELPMPDVKGVAERAWRTLSEASPGDEDLRATFFHRRMLERRCVSMVANAVGQALAAIDSGDYATGTEALVRAAGPVEMLEDGSSGQLDYWRHLVRLEARRQCQADMLEALENLQSVNPDRLEFLWESYNGHVLLGLAGHAATRELGDQVRDEQATRQTLRPSGHACWRSYIALWLNRHGRPHEALEHLRAADAQDGGYRESSESVRSRIDAQYAESWRLLGEFRRASDCLDQAAARCQAGGLPANALDYVATTRAKLLADTGNRQAAYELLHDEVLPQQVRIGMPSALRTSILIGRLLPVQEIVRGEAASLRELVARETAASDGFATCPTCAKVLAHWDTWCRGGPDPAPLPEAQATGTFWGL